MIVSVIPKRLAGDLARHGRQVGSQIILTSADYQRASVKPSTASAPLPKDLFPGLSIRSAEEQAALLAICETCPRNRTGRCALCRSCGGGIPVKDWVRLSSHRCPDKKW